jgi:hypothetical protein
MPNFPVPCACPVCRRLLATWTTPSELRLADGVHAADIDGVAGGVVVYCPGCIKPIEVPGTPEEAERWRTDRS